MRLARSALNHPQGFPRTISSASGCRPASAAWSGVPGRTRADASRAAPMYSPASLARDCCSTSGRFGLEEAFAGEVAQQVMQPVADEAGRVDAGDVDEDRVHELLEQLLGIV